MNEIKYVKNDYFLDLNREEFAQIKEFEILLLLLNCSHNMLKKLHLEAENYGRKNLMFMEGMVHEIKAPMNEVLRISQYMKEGGALLALRSGMLKKATKRGAELLELIDEVLDMIIVD